MNFLNLLQLCVILKCKNCTEQIIKISMWLKSHRNLALKMETWRCKNVTLALNDLNNMQVDFCHKIYNYCEIERSEDDLSLRF